MKESSLPLLLYWTPIHRINQHFISIAIYAVLLHIWLQDYFFVFAISNGKDAQLLFMFNGKGVKHWMIDSSMFVCGFELFYFCYILMERYTTLHYVQWKRFKIDWSYNLQAWPSKGTTLSPYCGKSSSFLSSC